MQHNKSTKFARYARWTANAFHALSAICFKRYMTRNQMFSKLMKISILLVLFPIGNSALAGQGFTCFDFNKLQKGEKEQYVKGYTLGAAMELLYLKSNYSKEEYPSEYVTEKYKLISIGVGYPNDFFEFAVKECNYPGASDAGMFDVLPVALTKMQKTGKFKVP